MNRVIFFATLLVLPLAGCDGAGGGAGGTLPEDATRSLPEAKRGFQTKLRPNQTPEPVEHPPPNVFQLVRYRSPAGNLPAYLSPDPGDGKEHPAIVWITGGDCNTIGDVWSPASAENDQTAAAYRQAGIIMMFPSLRGGNDNPGLKESFLGEVDDVIAAGESLAQQPYVDPRRIYLGGHSTGGTLVLLVAETTDQFRAVFSFGPVDDAGGYGSDFLPFDTSNPREIVLRSPGYWLHSIQCPTFVFEGTSGGNVSALRTMSRTSGNSLIRLYPIRGADHFSTLAPTNALIAAKILRDDRPTVNVSFTEEELNRPFGR